MKGRIGISERLALLILEYQLGSVKVPWQKNSLALDGTIVPFLPNHYPIDAPNYTV
jgi:hypothetical protein